MSYIVLLIVLSLMVYRVSRFIVLDTLIDGTRSKVEDWLMAHRSKLLFRKLYELMGCPYCVTIWVALGAVLVSYFFVDSIPLPLYTWLAVSSGALVCWAIIDSDEGKKGSG